MENNLECASTPGKIEEEMVSCVIDLGEKQLTFHPWQIDQPTSVKQRIKKMYTFVWPRLGKVGSEKVSQLKERKPTPIVNK